MLFFDTNNSVLNTILAGKVGDSMWIVLPAFYLAIIRIAGDNIGVVPDAAHALNSGIFATTIVAYMVLGSLLNALLAWIGVRSGQELVILAKRMIGYKGKKIVGFNILAVCIPASALTGCYFSGWIIHSLTGWPQSICGILCMILFSVMAAGVAEELLKVSNYLALLLIPIILLLWITNDVPLFDFQLDYIDWPLVFALIGYNAGGMHSVLAVETAAYLTKKGCKVVVLAILSKVVEAMITLLMVQLVVTFGTAGPLALAEVVKQALGSTAYSVFSIIIFCAFMNVMVPAMLVNARQVSSITGVSFRPALIIAAVTVYFTSLLDYNYILCIMSVTGIVMAATIVYISYYLHAHYIKR